MQPCTWSELKGLVFLREAVMLFVCRKAGLLSGEPSAHMQAMVGLRNVAVHDYQKLNLAIVRTILNEPGQRYSTADSAMERTTISI